MTRNSLFRCAARVAAPFFFVSLLTTPLVVEAEESVELDDLVVTAGLEPVSRKHVAASITVIDREEIELKQARNLADLLRDVPGFAVSQAGGAGSQTQIRVRGAEGNHLLVLIDGIRANDPASGDEFNFQYQSTANIERIEIIRGPQSAIWGTDALAGVINIIRRRDVADHYASGQLEYGSAQSLLATADGGFTRSGLTLVGGLSWAETNGTNISREGGERDGAENRNAHLSLAYRPGGAWTLRLQGQYVKATTDFDAFDNFGTGLPVDANNVTEAERRYARGEVLFEPVDSRWSGAFSLNRADTENENFVSGAWESATRADTLESRLRGSVLFGTEREHRLTLALDREDVDFSQRGMAFPWGDPNQDQSYDRTGYAAEFVSSPLPGFTWTANARQDDFSDFDDAFTWQLAASQRLGAGMRLRGSVGTGSKAPTFIERFGFYPDTFIGNPDLKPETSKGWEIGFDQAFLGNRFEWSAVYFDQQLEDEIDGFVFDPETFLFTAMNRDGKSDRKGVELGLVGELAPDLDVAISWTFLDATQRDADGTPSKEIRRPDNMGHLNVNWRFADRRGNLNLNVNYNGSQLDNYFPPPFFIAETVKLESFTLVGLAASWRLADHLELTARVTNLLDEDYEEILGFARPGRQVYAGLRARFGN